MGGKVVSQASMSLDGYIAWADAGASVIGRRLFDLTNGWNGKPVGEAVFVVTTGRRRTGTSRMPPSPS
jgi:hypothetical protein